ncbi:hypothetical protein N7326_07225 [Corynebacterium sp. ES2794-CONJ1]|uniref:hypothetical protein n=1 Tax=unclassified Corynebacterium TaxID=2624378 RepID=UPI00216B196F|nr:MULTISPECIES: hypothetical protein [unclassified Corynebacterium]MCS4532376.1 hypothetical protein [Corynebacterium sp. ES2730-CONJ]MCU9519661.1 hypothetical protein [Corynebacterium sp. ES2794-CONJ1]
MRAKTFVITGFALILTACSSPDQGMNSAESTPGCPYSTLDLAETALGVWLPHKIIRTSDTDNQVFEFRVRDNHFDPCQPLSWVVLEGNLNNENLSQPGSRRESMLLFSHDKLITDAPYFLAQNLSDIHSETGLISATVDGSTIRYRLLNSGVDLEGDLQSTPLHLDFTTAPPADITPASLRGNAHHKVISAQADMAKVLGIPMGEHEIYCDFENAENFICEDHSGFDPWPTTTGAGRGNYIKGSLKFPPELDVDWFAPRLGKAEENLPHNALITLGDISVDTRGETVRIVSHDNLVTLGDGIADLTPEVSSTVDTSRYPKNLKPWTS